MVDDTLNIINPLCPPVPCKVLKGVAKLPPSLLPSHTHAMRQQLLISKPLTLVIPKQPNVELPSTLFIFFLHQRIYSISICKGCSKEIYILVIKKLNTGLNRTQTPHFFYVFYCSSHSTFGTYMKHTLGTLQRLQCVTGPQEGRRVQRVCLHPSPTPPPMHKHTHTSTYTHTHTHFKSFYTQASQIRFNPTV